MKKLSEIEKDVRPACGTVKKKTSLYMKAAILSVCVLIAAGLFTLRRLVYAFGDMKQAHPYEVVFSRTLMDDFAGDLESLMDEGYEKEVLDLLAHPFYDSDINYYMYEGSFSYGSTAAWKAWRHARDLFYSGKIHGADTDYQCTFFAQMWFYDIYGFNSSGNAAAGNGDSFAWIVYSTAVYYDEEGTLHHLFKLDDHPETMGIVSISGGTPHVICIDEVDPLADTITFSDGNYDYAGGVRIRETVSSSVFYYLNPGRYTFVNPTQELLQMIKER